jgi:Flp pilus assembly protein CpaB
VESITASKLFTTRQGTVLLGVIAAVIAAIALLVYLNSYRNSVTPAPVSVLVAQALIQKGTSGDVIRTSPGVYKPVNIANAQVENGAITNPQSLAGKVATTDISPGQQLTESDFGTGTAGVAGQLHPPDRAVTVQLTSPQQVGGQLSAGSHVDVWVAFNGQQANGISRPVVRELFQNMTVLTASSSGGNNANVTLEAKPAEAGALIFATQNAQIWLVLRPTVGTIGKPPTIGVTNLLGRQSLRLGG